MWLPRAIVWLLVWLIALAMIVAGLALSPWGTHWLLDQAQSRGILVYDSVEGAPLDDLHIHGLHLELSSMTIDARDFRLDWSSDCLYRGRLCIDQLAGESIRVEMHPVEKAPSPEAQNGNGMPHISTPIPIELRALAVDDLSVILANGTRVGWQSLHSSVTFEGKTLTLGRTRWQSPRLILPIPATLDAPDLLESDVNVRTARRVANGNMVTLDAINLSKQLAAAGGDDRADSRGLLKQISRQAARQSLVQNSELAPGIVNLEPAPVEDTTERNPLLAQLLNGRGAANPLVAIIGRTDEQGRVDLPDITLPLNIEIPDFEIDDLRLIGPTPLEVRQLRLAMQAHDDRISISQLNMDSPDGTLDLAASARLSGDYPLSVSLDAAVQRAPVSGERLALDVSGSLSNLKLSLVASGPAPLTLKAGADVLAPELPLELHVSSSELRWPLAGAVPADAVYRISDLALDLTGSLADYRLNLDTHARGPKFKPLRLSLEGQGDISHFQWAPLTVTTTQGGTLSSQGEARWAPGIDVQASLSLDRFRLQDVTSTINGTLDGQLESRFTRQGRQWSLAVPKLDIHGTLQNRALSMQARLDGNSDMVWHIQQLELRQGSNRISASGEVADRLSLQADITAPSLNTVLPELGGSLNGRIQLDGTLKQPDTEISLDGNNVHYGANRISSLALKATSSGRDDPRFNIDLNVRGIEAGGQQVQQVALTLAGKLSQHHLTLDVTGGETLPISQADLELDGRFNQGAQRYQGSLGHLDVATRQAGTLALQAPLTFAVDLAASRVTAEPFCLSRQQGGRLCSTQPLQASADQGSAELALDALPMSLLADYLPDRWQVSGESNATVDASWSRGGAQWQADLSLDTVADISGENARGQPVSLPQANISLNARATPARADARLNLTLADAGSLSLQTQVNDPLGGRQISGRLQVNDMRLAPYQPLAEGLKQLEGALNGDVTLNGSLQQPLLNGKLVLSGVQASGKQLPVSLDDARLALNLQGDQGTLDGYLAVNNARWNIVGSANWPTTADWQARLSLDGGRSPLEVELPQFGRIRIAPKINVAATPEQLDITGRVRVPWARLAVGHIQLPPSTVKPSSDAVIITREEDAAMRNADGEAGQAGSETPAWANTGARTLENAGMEVNVNVNVIIGDDVHLEAYGLATNLEGTLTVRQNSGALQLFGDVSLVNGRFQSFGQDLLIRQGKVIFGGPPSQPHLQFEAIRNPEETEDDVIAGLRVTGTASAPQLQIFSEPDMDESSALSYILRGHAPDTEGASSSDALTSALVGLSLSRSGRAIGSLGESFGVQDLSLDTSGSGEASQVVVSGYLFDRLKISYGVGLFSPIAELTLRYKLVQDLYLQAVSGANQALDLLYTFSLGHTRARDVQQRNRQRNSGE